MVAQFHRNPKDCNMMNQGGLILKIMHMGKPDKKAPKQRAAMLDELKQPMEQEEEEDELEGEVPPPPEAGEEDADQEWQAFKKKFKKG
jgi:hypothetical protein